MYFKIYTEPADESINKFWHPESEIKKQKKAKTKQTKSRSSTTDKIKEAVALMATFRYKN